MKAKDGREERVDSNKDYLTIRITQERYKHYAKILHSMIILNAVIIITFSSFLWLGVFQVFACLHIHQDDVQPFLHEHVLE